MRTVGGLGIYFEPEQAAYYFNKKNVEVIDRGISRLADHGSGRDWPE